MRLPNDLSPFYQQQKEEEEAEEDIINTYALIEHTTPKQQKRQ